MVAEKKVYFEKLDSLRFFCFLSVFFYHSFHTDFEEIKSSSVYHFVTNDLFPNGNLGVNFFFVLSGFLITYLLIKEQEKNGQIHLVKFWVRRILRIWPLYFLCVFFGFVIFPYLKVLFGQESLEIANPLYYVLFISNFDILSNGMPDASILGVLWSVAIEEQFYLVWPVILFFIPYNRYWIVFIVIITQSIVFRMLNDGFAMHEFHTLSCIGDMAVGGLLGWIMSRKESIPNFNKLPRLSILFCYIGFMVFYLFRKDFVAYNDGIAVFDRTVIALFIAGIIADQSFSKRPIFDVSKVTLINRLGRISYGLYCLHFVGILITLKLNVLLGFNQSLYQVLLLETFCALIITILLAELSWRLWERPFLKLKERYSA